MQRPSLKGIKYQTILGLLIAVLLTGCAAWGWGVAPTSTPTLEPSLIDSSILTGLPCAAPCWYGLEIGRSTKSDILATARSLSFIDQKEFPEDPSSYFDPSKRVTVTASVIRLNCRQPEGAPCASLLVVNDVLKRIDLSPSVPLTLGEAVAHLGPPEYVAPSAVAGSAGLCNVVLVWKQRNIEVFFRSDIYGGPPPRRDQVRCRDVHSSKDVSPNLPVSEITYWSPDDLAIVSESGDLPWSGFAQP